VAKSDNINYSTVRELASEANFSEPAFARALDLAGVKPAQADWLRYIHHFLVTIGSLLIVFGIAAFIAGNWADLSYMIKFALIQGAIVIAALCAWRLGINSTAGGAALFAAAFLIGVLFALFGQVYQTGADPYGLFLTWAVFVFPLAIIGRQAGLWILFQTLLVLTLIMYWTQVVFPPTGQWDLREMLGPLTWIPFTFSSSSLAASVFALNAVGLVIWEIAAHRNIHWAQGRTYPRVVGFVALMCLVVPMIVYIAEWRNTSVPSAFWYTPVLFMVGVVFALYYYRFRKPDLLMLTMLAFSIILVIIAIQIRFVDQTFESLLFIAIVLIALVAAAAYWLRGVSQQWERSHVS